MNFLIVEKRHRNAVHGAFDSRERAVRHLEQVIPVHIAKWYFSDKSLKAEDFEIVEEEPRG